MLLSDLKFQILSGEEALPYLSEIAKIRISVFKEWPYLYEGDCLYEKKYLQRYIQTQRSFLELVFDDETLVGMTSAIDMVMEDAKFKTSFLEQGFNPDDLVYFGESILLSKYRGLGVGRKFIKDREIFAKNLENKKYVCFCSVVRSDDHPLKNNGYRPLNTFWTSQGFHQIKDFSVQMSWKDIGEQNESPKPLQVWIKEI